jgi:hypothetical protein
VIITNNLVDLSAVLKLRTILRVYGSRSGLSSMNAKSSSFSEVECCRTREEENINCHN